MIRHKISRIAKLTVTSYSAAKKRVENLAPVMEGIGAQQRLDAACEKILEKIDKQSVVFRNVDFTLLYKDLI